MESRHRKRYRLERHRGATREKEIIKKRIIQVSKVGKTSWREKEIIQKEIKKKLSKYPGLIGRACPPGHSERRRRAATKVREYRVESEDRGKSRKQREPTATNRHREDLVHRARLRSSLKHTAENHMFYGNHGKSIFQATNLCDIWNLVHRTLTCPDEEVEDKSKRDRLVLKKSFNTPIGVHGFKQTKCYTVKVVYDQVNRRIVTAYPM